MSALFIPGPAAATTRVRAATTTTITIASDLNPGDVLDGLTLAAGDLVLVKNQLSPAQNGIYIVAAVPVRTSSYPAFSDYPGLAVIVEEGATNADTGWLCVSDRGGTLGTTALNFVRTPALVTNLAYLSNLGNDSLARIGDRDRPFATLQAAYNAGARSFDCGAGFFGSLVCDGSASTLYFTGAGTVVGDIYTQFDLEIYASGGELVRLGNITGQGSSTTGTIGDPGGSGPILSLSHCYVVGNVNSIGGDGAANHFSGPGGPGGGGGRIILFDTHVTGNVLSRGGNGGVGDAWPGGAGGNGERILLRANSTVDLDVTSAGGDGGATDSSIGSAGGNGGEVDVQQSTVLGTASAPGGAAGAAFYPGYPGAQGSTYFTLAIIGAAPAVTTRVGSSIGGVFYTS